MGSGINIYKMDFKTLYNEITILIVMYEESYDIISKNLENIKNFKKIIIDNANNKILKTRIKNQFLIDEYILNDKNLGYSKAYNQAITLSKTQFSLILNPDCIICEEDILKLYKAFSIYNNCFIAVPTSYDENFNFTYCGGPLPEKDLTKEIAHKLSGDICIETAISACWLVENKNFINIGLFDETFFLYFADDDFCNRVKKNKKSVIQVYDSKCFHTHGISKVRSVYKRIFLKEYNYVFDSLYYFHKHSKTQLYLDYYKNKIPKLFFKLFTKFFFFQPKDFVKIISKILAYYKFLNFIR